MGERLKIYEIGEWNMDSDESISIQHTLELKNIKKIESVIIKKDTGDIFIEEIPSPEIYIGITEKHITISREQGGRFDNSNYDATSYNRGYISIVKKT
ncbi:MAG: hypothetical protein V3U75_01445 [Methylococcaceae bacterium]